MRPTRPSSPLRSTQPRLLAFTPPRTPPFTPGQARLVAKVDEVQQLQVPRHANDTHATPLLTPPTDTSPQVQLYNRTKGTAEPRPRASPTASSAPVEDVSLLASQNREIRSLQRQLQDQEEVTLHTRSCSHTSTCAIARHHASHDLPSRQASKHRLSQQTQEHVQQLRQCEVGADWLHA